MFSEECFEKFVFWQRANVQGHVVPVVLELLEIVSFQVNVDEFIPLKHRSIFIGELEMPVNHPQDLAAFNHLPAVGKGSLLNLDLLAELT